ncbi:hypothetical protein EI42_04697 [Thermosporothrix hazakensis]|jgi:hypothetical protein|uniref:Type VII secretion system (Wss) protein ESAT-6 n=2 Tax=Thermosporothrix TaxID=768650 RepID=A0A326U192_THEHA|nr:hypothetical protein [Thermosporothrix hazakensis]PZW24249.1 hypothetical protein EI42_04697 [Thermosporothrix hazakensis]BBH89694.1 hypothetical protein KTC_44450 [Thermosporothrix sp. COM3]GCE47880.1 hypothetical protein KTH_27490 [Thermosporothrix hazakensis]
MATTDEKFRALLQDLQELSNYLHGRGDKTRALSQQFAANAQRDASNREFDLNQSRMLDYQHHIWHEIGNKVDQLIKLYEKNN